MVYLSYVVMEYEFAQTAREKSVIINPIVNDYQGRDVIIASNPAIGRFADPIPQQLGPNESVKTLSSKRIRKCKNCGLSRCAGGFGSGMKGLKCDKKGYCPKCQEPSCTGGKVKPCLFTASSSSQ